MKIGLFLVTVFLSSMALAQGVQEGVLQYEYGDLPSGGYVLRYSLATDQGEVPLQVSDEFRQSMPIHQWAGKLVRVSFNVGQVNKVQAVQLLEGANRGGVSGTQPWVSILCKFADIADEPEDLQFFEGMYANQPAGLDHYWREVSYDTINVVGSTAVDWVNLPEDQTTYIPSPGNDADADLSSLFNDCTAAVDSVVDFSNGGLPYAGINMMFNSNLDCCAWGGGRFATLDGVTKVWRTTWNPPWAFGSEAVIAHEMGHGFGLPHANNSDGDTNPYDNPWDVMSAATGYSVIDSVYGRLGKHVNMYFKHQLGWVTDSDGFIANSNSDNIITIDHTAIASTPNERFARIPLSDGTFYMVEARKELGNYEANIPGTAVIIHHVNTSRQEPPWVVDQSQPAADYADTKGVMWEVGETFVDPIDGFRVEVLSSTANGFSVHILAPSDLIFEDGFE